MICPVTDKPCKTNGCGDKCYKRDSLDKMKLIIFLLIFVSGCLGPIHQSPYNDKNGVPISVGDTILYPDFDIGSETDYRHCGVLFFDRISRQYYLDSQNTVEMDEIDWSVVERTCSD